MRRLDDGRATLPTPILTIAWYVWVIGTVWLIGTVWQSCLLPLHLGQEQSSLGALNGAHMVLADHIGLRVFSGGWGRGWSSASLPLTDERMSICDEIEFDDLDFNGKSNSTPTRARAETSLSSRW